MILWNKTSSKLKKVFVLLCTLIAKHTVTNVLSENLRDRNVCEIETLEERKNLS